MSEMTQSPQPPKTHLLPLVGIAVVTVVGGYLLRDTLSFETLTANREALVAFRDSHYLMTVIGFVLAYVAIVAFSLPGATVATLAGGFLFGTFPGVLINVTAATLGACAIFSAARWGLGDLLAARMDASEGQIKRIKTNEKAQERNKAVKSELKTAVRATRTAVAEGDKAKATAALQNANRKLDKAVSKGVIHKNQAANRKSSIAKQVAAL